MDRTRRRRLLTGVLALTTSLVVLTSTGATQARADQASDQDGPPVVQTRSDGSIRYTDDSVDGATTRLSGTLETIIVEPAPTAVGHSSLLPHDDETQYAVVSSSGRLTPLDLDADLPTSSDGRTVAARIDDDGSVASATLAPSSAPASPSALVGGAAQHLYLAIADNAGSFPAATTEADITGDVGQVLSRWVTEANGGIKSFDLTSTKHVNLSGGCQDGAANWEQAKKLWPNVTNWSGESGNHLAVVTGNGCVFGLGTIGRGLASGGLSSVSYVGKGSLQQNLAHELGHNFGLRHTNAENCSNGTCQEFVYGNYYNVMGVSFSGGIPIAALDTGQRIQLGVVDTGEVLSPALQIGAATTTGSVNLLGRGTTTGARGMRLVDPVDKSVWYVDYRNGAVRDQGSYYDRYSGAAGGYQAGLTVEELTSDGVTTDLQSWTSSTASKGYDYSRKSGQTWISPSGGITLAVRSAASGETGSVRVDYTFNSASVAVPPPPSTAPAPTPVPAPTASTEGNQIVGARPTIRVAPGARAARPMVGKRARVVLGDYRTAPTGYAYQWYLNSRPIAGATGTSYRIARSAAGKRLSVVVTATRAEYASSVMRSPRTAKVQRR